MPKHKKGGNLASSESKRRKMKERRRNETDEEQEERLASLREARSRRNDQLTDEQRDEIREEGRIRKSTEILRDGSKNELIKNKMREVRENQQSQAHKQNISIQEVRRRKSRNYSLTGEAFHYDPTLEYHKHKHVIIGEMDQVCQLCSAKKFSRESPGMCCMN